jgi:Fe-S-cluster containining protein
MSLEDEIERRVAAASREVLEGKNEPERLSEFFLLLEETAQSLINKHLILSPPPTPLHCKPGCSYCCHAKHILLTPPEALFLLGIIESCGFRFAVTAAARSTRPGCPLMDGEGQCRFYPHRPLICRAFHSLDVEECKKGVGDEGLSVPVWLPHYEIYTRIQAGMARGLMEMGRAMPKLDLRRVLALQAPVALIWEQWMKGENPFAAAEME